MVRIERINRDKFRMGVLQALKQGVLATSKHLRLVLLFFLANFLWASLLTLPMHHLLDNTIGHSLISQDLAQELHFQFLFEFYHEQGSAIKTIFLLVFYFGVLYIFLNTFLLGGALEIFDSSDGEFSLKNFFAGCGQYFWRFLRLFLIFLLVLFFLLTVNSALSGMFNIIAKRIPDEAFRLYLRFFRWAIMVVLLLLINMLFDYAKIITVTQDTRSVFLTLLDSIKFIMTHKLKTFSLYYLVFACGIFFLLIYLLGARLVSSPASVVILFLWQQVYILSKIGIKLTFYSSQMALWKKYIS